MRFSEYSNRIGRVNLKQQYSHSAFVFNSPLLFIKHFSHTFSQLSCEVDVDSTVNIYYIVNETEFAVYKWQI